MAIIFSFKFFKKDNKNFTLNNIKDVNTSEVQTLFNNITFDSCYEKVYFEMNKNTQKIDISKIDKRILLDYVFTNLYANKLLNDKLTIDIINNKSHELFAKNIAFDDILNEYCYDGYQYQYKNNVISKNKKECSKEYQMVYKLFGYSYNPDYLSVDINVGYLKDDTLYDLSSNKLGNYDENLEKMSIWSLFRYNYVKVKDKYKLDNIEIVARG